MVQGNIRRLRRAWVDIGAIERGVCVVPGTNSGKEEGVGGRHDLFGTGKRALRGTPRRISGCPPGYPHRTRRRGWSWCLGGTRQRISVRRSRVPPCVPARLRSARRGYRPVGLSLRCGRGCLPGFPASAGSLRVLLVALPAELQRPDCLAGALASVLVEVVGLDGASAKRGGQRGASGLDGTLRSVPPGVLGDLLDDNGGR